MNSPYIYLLNVSLESVITDLIKSITEGVKWGNTVAIALTASLLAISLIRFLFDRS